MFERFEQLVQLPEPRFPDAAIPFEPLVRSDATLQHASKIVQLLLAPRLDIDEARVLQHAKVL